MPINTNDGTGLKDLPAIPQIPDNVGKLDVKGIYDRVVQGLGAQTQLGTNLAGQEQTQAILGQQTAQADANKSLIPSNTATTLAQNAGIQQQTPLNTAILGTQANRAVQTNQPDIDASVAKLNEDKLQSQLGAIYTKAGLSYGQSDANAIETIKNSNLMRLQNSPGGFVSTPINPDNPALGSLVTFMGPNGPENHVTLPSASYISAQTRQQQANSNERWVQDYADPSTGRVTGHSVLVDSAGNVKPSNRPATQWDPSQGPPGQPYDQGEVDKLQAAHGKQPPSASTGAAPSQAAAPVAQGSPAAGAPVNPTPSAPTTATAATPAPVVTPPPPGATAAPVQVTTPEELTAALAAGKSAIAPNGKTYNPPAPAAAAPTASGASAAAPAIGHAPGQATPAAGAPNPQLLNKEDKDDVQELMATIAAKQQLLSKVNQFQALLPKLPGGEDPSGSGTFIDRSENLLAAKMPNVAAAFGIDAGQQNLAAIGQQIGEVMKNARNVRNLQEFTAYKSSLPEADDVSHVKTGKVATTKALISNDLARDQEALANIIDRGMSPIKAQAEALKKYPGNIELPSF